MNIHVSNMKFIYHYSILKPKAVRLEKKLYTRNSLNYFYSFVFRYFVEDEASRKERESETLNTKQKVDRQETEQFYLAKFREYILNSNRISRLQAKYDHIRKCLGDKNSAGPTATLPRPIASSRRRIGRTMAGQPKLFGGSLEEYLESTKEDIPLVVKSCVRMINLYGLHHQGIFRVSGSQVNNRFSYRACSLNPRIANKLNRRKRIFRIECYFKCNRTILC